MRRHGLAALLSLPLLALLWYLPALAYLYWYRTVNTWSGGPKLSEIGVDSTPEDLALFLASPADWRFAAVGVFLLAAVVVGFALAARRLSPVVGVVTGLPLAVLGMTGMWSQGLAEDIAKALPAFGGARTADGTTALGASHLLGLGGYLVFGVALLVSALPVPRRRAHPALSALAGLFALVVPLVCYVEGVRGGSGALRVTLMVIAGIVVGFAAASPWVSRIAPLVGGLPLFVFGIWGMIDSHLIFSTVNSLVPLPSDLSDDELMLRLTYRDILNLATPFYTAFGGAMLFAAAAPWKRVTPAPAPAPRLADPVPTTPPVPAPRW